MEDVGINQNQFNVGQQMLSLGIVLFEIPSNMILYRVGPGKWLTLQLFLFGIVSTFQAFQRGYGPFIASRFLLGMTESGFIPGGLWTLSTWYTRKETAKRVMIFYFGNQFGQASSKLLAYGILHMRGVGGKPGWFWLFVIMGTFTILSGFVLGFLLPDSFKKPRSTFLPRVSLFTERELHILKTRVLLDDPMKGKKKKSIGLSAIKKTVGYHQHPLQISCPLPLLLLLLTFSLLPVLKLASMDPLLDHTVQQRTPTCLRHIFPINRQRLWFRCPHKQRTGFCWSLPPNPNLVRLQLCFGSFVSQSHSQIEDLEITRTTLIWMVCHSNKRGETVMAGLSMHLLGYVFNRIFTEINRRGLRYFGVVWTQTFGTFSHPLNIAWMSLACDDSEERALAMAM
jgi:Major Facilitator Superfamily